MDYPQHILQFVLNLFLKDGIYKTSMDQIARKMHISKKTMYKHFRSKNELVIKASELMLVQTRASIFNVVESDDNGIQKINNILQILVAMGLRISNQFLNDMEVHYPDAWQNIVRLRNETILKVFSKIFNQGKAEKNFKEYPTDIILTVFQSIINGIVNPGFLTHANYSVDKAATLAFEIVLNGILTEKGQQEFAQLKEDNTL